MAGAAVMSRIDQVRTKKAYGLQWNRYRIVRPEEDRATFWNRTRLAGTDLTGTDLTGKVVLDAGCGMGRYLRIAAESSARLVVGLDLSRAVVAARDLTADLPRVGIVRGDMLQMPFAPQSFDEIYSLGVLDHTPDPRAAFLSLARLVKPGGRFVVWVYPRERRLIEWIMDAQRAVSTRLPLTWLDALCHLVAPLGGIKRGLLCSRRWLIQRLGVVLHLATIGVSMHPDPEVRVCDTLDWYAPRYMSRHSFDEVAAWFAEAGLTELVDLSRNQAFYHEGQGNGINIAGIRPLETAFG
jgi:SAM-dependent methyltransferase